MEKKASETISREVVVTLLRRCGMHDQADEAERTLPEFAEHAHYHRLLASKGISLEKLMDRLGGSP